MKSVLDHICIPVTDIAASVSFYENIFDLIVERHIVNPEGEVTHCFLVSGSGLKLELQKVEKKPAGNLHFHISFKVENMIAMIDYLSNKGISVTGPINMPSGNTIAYIDDINGNKIELIQYQ